MSSRRLSLDDRENIKKFVLSFCNMKQKPGEEPKFVLARGKLNEAALKWNVSRRSIQTLWATIQDQQKNGDDINVKSRQVGNKRVKAQLDMDAIKNIEPFERRAIRQLADKLKVSISTVHRWKKEKCLQRKTSHVKPEIQENHKVARLKYALQALEVALESNEENNVTFKDMHTTIHIDEKWFYIQKVKDKYILLPEEETPYTSCKSKHYVPKLMFFCAVSRPVFGLDGEVIWDGKLGIWPFAEEVVAKYTTKNRVRGTKEPKPIDKVTREQQRKMIIENLIPAIKQKWPSCLSKDIVIQQDNAKPHLLANDPKFIQASTSDGFNIKLKNQPAYSPDTNINDLGFFNSIQSLQQKKMTRSMAELINAVDSAYNDLDAKTLNKVFLSLQGCIIEIMKNRGHNDYKIPHMAKHRLDRAGLLPINLVADTQLVKDCIEYLMSTGHDVGNVELLIDIGYVPGEILQL